MTGFPSGGARISFRRQTLILRRQTLILRRPKRSAVRGILPRRPPMVSWAMKKRIPPRKFPK